MRRPPKRHCIECGKDGGRGWSPIWYCADCRPNFADTENLCKCHPDTGWNEKCPTHKTRESSPYEIPY